MRIKKIEEKSFEEIREEIQNGILYIKGTDVLDNDVTIEVPNESIANLENIASFALSATLAENKEENK